MDARRRARQVENATNQCDTLAFRQGNDAFAEARDCQSCGQILGQRPGGPMCNWDAFPAGVKFDPTDEELLQHLKAANGVGGAKSHPFINNFISELEGDEGICQTHPEKLPGVKKDGSSKHFFHRPAKAYTTGTRKRRKISCEEEEAGVETRWHKTGKTRSVSEDGRILGWKKIMVLYRNTGPKKAKSEKTNWILHQYHLGQSEEETDGELVVCKVFYQKQPRQCTGGRSAEGVASEMENVDLNQGSKDASVCVSEVSRGEGVPVTPKVDEQQRLRSSRDAPGNRGTAAITQSSKGSELTVIGKDTQAAIASELTSTPLSSKNKAIFPSFRAGNCRDAENGTSSMVNNGHQDTTGNYPALLYEEVTADTSDKPYQVENGSSLCGVNGRALDDCQQFLPSLEHDSQQPYLDDKDFPYLNCEEEMDQQFFAFSGYNCEFGDVEEPYVSNPNEDYPPVDDISLSLLGSPPAIIQEFMFSSQEAAEVLYPPNQKSFLDNDDSLSSTQ